MAEAGRAKLHRVLGGYVCRTRGRHNLVLSEQHWYERTGVVEYLDVGLPNHQLQAHQVEHRSERRPWCRTCWAHPAD